MKFSITLSADERDQFLYLIGQVAECAVKAHNALKEDNGYRVISSLTELEIAYKMLLPLAAGFNPVPDVPEFDDLPEGIFIPNKLITVQ